MTCACRTPQAERGRPAGEFHVARANASLTPIASPCPPPGLPAAAGRLKEAENDAGLPSGQLKGQEQGKEGGHSIIGVAPVAAEAVFQRGC